MADKTRIAWTDATWSPVSGCTKISNGCLNCYIDRTPPLRIAHRRFDKPGIGATTGVRLHPERLDQPARWRKGRRIFVCSLADLLHDDVPDRHIAEVWATMTQCPKHTFQVLTKRHARLRSLLNSARFWRTVSGILEARGSEPLPDGATTIPNVIVGVTAEDQQQANNRLEALRGTPAAVRMVSCEPLLERVRLNLDGIGWVIVGGESGPGARPMDPAWARDLIDQCRTSAVPVFMKQMGAVWASNTCVAGKLISRSDKAASQWENIPAGLRVREWPAGVTI